MTSGFAREPFLFRILDLFEDCHFRHTSLRIVTSVQERVNNFSYGKWISMLGTALALRQFSHSLSIAIHFNLHKEHGNVTPQLL